jgi:hypothetical protein
MTIDQPHLPRRLRQPRPAQLAVRRAGLASPSRRRSVACAIALCTLGAALAAQSRPPDVDPRIEKAIAAISEDRLRATVEKLTSFGTRNTLSDPSSPTRGIGAAREWLLRELQQASPRLQVQFESFRLPKQGRILKDGVELRNVIAVLPGRSSRRIYVSAHYDTVNIAGGQNGANANRNPGAAAPVDSQLDPAQNFDVDAPGANDDGSGTALTLELARVLAGSGTEYDATLVFALWAGEEQGLFGSRLHAQRLAAGKTAVDADFNNDIVGNSHGGGGAIDSTSVRIYAQGPEDSDSRSLARYVQRVAAIYVPSHRVRPMAREDRFNRGSDQASFNLAGFPAVVFREAVENFSRQHAANDTIDGVDFRYLAQNARVNAAAAASLALAPPAPSVTGDRNQVLIARRPSGYDADLQWQPSPGAVAYRIYWREAWSNDWQHSLLVGNTTGYTLPNVSIDDFVFGVAALAAEGSESLVRAYVASPRRDPEIKVIP